MVPVVSVRYLATASLTSLPYRSTVPAASAGSIRSDGDGQSRGVAMRAGRGIGTRVEVTPDEGKTIHAAPYNATTNVVERKSARTKRLRWLILQPRCHARRPTDAIRCAVAHVLQFCRHLDLGPQRHRGSGERTAEPLTHGTSPRGSRRVDRVGIADDAVYRRRRETRDRSEERRV